MSTTEIAVCGFVVVYVLVLAYVWALCKAASRGER